MIMFAYKFFNFLRSPMLDGSGPVNPILNDKSLQTLDHMMRTTSISCMGRWRKRLTRFPILTRLKYTQKAFLPNCG